MRRFHLPLSLSLSLTNAFHPALSLSLSLSVYLVPRRRRLQLQFLVGYVVIIAICCTSHSSRFHALAPGILDSTLDRSTPVRALIEGGSCATRRVTSLVILSLPPISTISSVLAKGAATSAAICKERRSVRTLSLSLSLISYLGQRFEHNVHDGRISVLFVDIRLHTHTLCLRLAHQLDGVCLGRTDLAYALRLGACALNCLASVEGKRLVGNREWEIF